MGTLGREGPEGSKDKKETKEKGINNPRNEAKYVRRHPETLGGRRTVTKVPYTRETVLSFPSGRRVRRAKGEKTTRVEEGK